ncbi:HNH endonuclease family protein [Rhodopirellula baltica]|uniref:HNH nuclease domain-containing protein n=1 Tax=Rhodopirellula baltica SWK14 TaxID=993516 RepID=L7CIY9_RHOBT|nr:hypothetical protein [Rhodopirellula baltica]ELP33810.1 hypothetical protein RBSWK_01946 [Rhodopirellula baltica SWK14]
MIYVRRDSSIIPAEVLNKAEKAQEELEKICDPAKRKEFIKKKSAIWGAFKACLAKMSYGKCWYSESDDPQSFFDVDHFRPKGEAKRSDKHVDDFGYDWLAFSWENFRYSATKSNRLLTNDETGDVDGKGSWFPLVDGSRKAHWGDRCEKNEKPVLIDPCNNDDVKLLDVDANGRIVPSVFAVGTAVQRVKRSAEIYGLNHPSIVGKRKQLMRELSQLLETLADTLVAAKASGTLDSVADTLPVEKQLKFIESKTKRSSPYALTARSYLTDNGYGRLCVSPEEDCESIK